MDGGRNNVLKEVKGAITIIAEKDLRKSKGRIVDKKLWWQNKEKAKNKQIQEVIAMNKKKFKQLQRTKRVEV